MLNRLTFLFLDEIGEALSSAFTSIANSISDSIISGVKYVIGLLGYFVSIAVCKLVALFYSFFEVFSGMETVTYDSKSKYLINVFFEQSSVNTAYWGMAVLSFVLLFAFTIAAVIRKFFDLNDKQKQSYGQILANTGKAVLIILLMSGIISVSLSVTNVLMQRINYLFDVANTPGGGAPRSFTPTEYATMNNIFETIGNYSLNPSYNSRYNINSCFNAIRDDMYYLQKEGVFDYDYTVASDDGSGVISNWQSTLQSIALASNLKYELKMDTYYAAVSDSILNAMKIIRTNADFYPVQTVVASPYAGSSSGLDTIVFLAGTATAAKNSFYNVDSSVTDAVRGPYYSGKKSVYNFTAINGDFEVSLGGINYTIIIIIGILMVWQLCVCILTCAARIFNLMLLYIIAPPFAATIPYDDGARFKQWVQAFIIQCVNVFGTVIVMRLVILYIPIVLSSKLVLFDNGFMNLCGKAILIYAGITAAARGADLISGLLSGNGASASVAAGNMSREGLAMAGLAADVTGASRAAAGVKNSWKRMADHGGVLGSTFGAKSVEEKNADAEHKRIKDKEEAEKKAQEGKESKVKKDSLSDVKDAALKSSKAKLAKDLAKKPGAAGQSTTAKATQSKAASGNTTNASTDKSTGTGNADGSGTLPDSQKQGSGTTDAQGTPSAPQGTGSGTSTGGGTTDGGTTDSGTSTDGGADETLADKSTPTTTDEGTDMGSSDIPDEPATKPIPAPETSSNVNVSQSNMESIERLPENTQRLMGVEPSSPGPVPSAPSSVQSSSVPSSSVPSSSAPSSSAPSSSIPSGSAPSSSTSSSPAPSAPGRPPVSQNISHVASSNSSSVQSSSATNSPAPNSSAPSSPAPSSQAPTQPKPVPSRPTVNINQTNNSVQHQPTSNSSSSGGGTKPAPKKPKK